MQSDRNFCFRQVRVWAPCHWNPKHVAIHRGWWRNFVWFIDSSLVLAWVRAIIVHSYVRFFIVKDWKTGSLGIKRVLFQFRVDIEHIEDKSCCFETFSHRFSNHRYTWMSGVERSGVERVKLEEELQWIRLGNCHPWQPKQHPSKQQTYTGNIKAICWLILCKKWCVLHLWGPMLLNTLFVAYFLAFHDFFLSEAHGRFTLGTWSGAGKGTADIFFGGKHTGYV